MDPNRIIIPITPQTNVRSVQKDKMLFRIPLECLKGRSGNGCAAYHRNFPDKFKKFKREGKRDHFGLCPHTLSKSSRGRLRRLQRYNQYKIDLLTLAKHHGFQVLPTHGWAIYFYIPMPVRWSKKKKKEMLGQLHLQTPDVDNFLKAVLDSMAITDEQVGQISGLGGFWIDMPKNRGYIEILLNQPVYNPFGVTFIDQGKYYKPKTLERKEKPVKKKKRRRKPQQQQLFLREDNIK